MKKDLVTTMDKQIFIINGSGGVGKDTFVEMVTDQSYRMVVDNEDNAIFVKYLDIGNYSSVSKIKEIAKIIGWNGEKTERHRKFLSDLKLLTTEYNDMPLNDMREYADYFFDSYSKCDDYGSIKAKILFLHIREPEEIAKAVKEFKEYNTKTLLIKRDSVKHITSNMADENVYNYDYDIVINNNSDFDAFKKKSRMFLKDFLNGTLKQEY